MCAPVSIITDHSVHPAVVTGLVLHNVAGGGGGGAVPRLKECELSTQPAAEAMKCYEEDRGRVCVFQYYYWDGAVDSSPFNLRTAGGSVWTPPSCGFSRIARKRRRAAPPGFHLPYPPSFWQLLWKFRSWVMQGQVTRSGQVTIPYKNFTIAPQLQCLRESYETFGIW